jgi:acyl-CoA synthetase (AMP-forming)/AMP-acid ligase II
VSRSFEAFLAAERRDGSAPAIVHHASDPRTTTYRALHELSSGYAAALADLVPDRSLLPILAGKSADSIALMLACLATGRPFAWLNKRLRAPQIADIAQTAAAQELIADASALLALGPAIREHPVLRAIRWIGIADGTRAGSAKALASAVQLLSDDIEVPVLAPASASGGAPIGANAPDAFACCLFTSGSTGRQKGVMIADGDLAARARSEVDWFGLTPRDRLLSILPFSFDVGLNQLLSALAAGACLVIEESWLPADVLKAIARDRVTGVSAVPSIWRDLLASPLPFDRAGDHESLRYVAVSGGSLSVGEQERLQQRLPGVAIFKTYGQTETFRSASLRPEELAQRPASVGRAYGGARVLVLREDGRRCAPDEVGEVVHVGLGTMLGYLDSASFAQRAEGERRPSGVHAGKIRALPPELGGDRAVFTGDYGCLDADGYLFLKGRMDAMVKIAGNRVYPEEAADQLRALAGVREAEVVAVAREGGDPLLVAFVVSDGAHELTSESVRKLALARLPAHMLPSETQILPELPRLANGKIDRRALDELARSELR